MPSGTTHQIHQRSGYRLTNPPDASLTVKTILEAGWTAANVSDTTPSFTTPATEKRKDLSSQDSIYIYCSNRENIKRGAGNDYHDRVESVLIDVETVHSLERFRLLRCEVERIIDLAASRSSPVTRPKVATYADAYTANSYDQLIPMGEQPFEDGNRHWWRTIYEVQLKTYWEAR